MNHPVDRRWLGPSGTPLSSAIALAVVLNLSMGSAAVADKAVVTASASVDSHVNYLGDRGRDFTLTVTNTGSQLITDVTIRERTVGVVAGCQSVSAGWTVKSSKNRCDFTAPRANAIAPAGSKAFVVRLSTEPGTNDSTGTFEVHVNSTLADPNPDGLAVTTYAWEITDAVVTAAAAPAVDSACPTSTRQVPSGATTVVICGLNHTTNLATPTNATLGGTLVAGSGAYTSGQVAPSSVPRVLGSWSGVSFNQSADSATITAQVSSAATATSP